MITQRGLWIFDKTVNSYRQLVSALATRVQKNVYRGRDVNFNRDTSNVVLSSLPLFLSLVSDSVKRCEPRGEGNWMGQLSPVQSRRDKITKDYYIRYSSASSLVWTWRTLGEIKGTCEWNLNLAARVERRSIWERLEGNWKKGNCLWRRLEKYSSLLCVISSSIFFFSRRFLEKVRFSFLSDG